MSRKMFAHKMHLYLKKTKLKKTGQRCDLFGSPGENFAHDIHVCFCVYIVSTNYGVYKLYANILLSSL